MCEFGKRRERGGFKLQWVEREGGRGGQLLAPLLVETEHAGDL